jgi:hypothetical protein
MTTGLSERLDRIIGCVKGNIGISSLYTLYELMLNCKYTKNIYCTEDNINKGTIISYYNIEIEDIKEEIGRGIVHYLYSNVINGKIKCDLTIEDPISLRRKDCINIADITFKELEEMGIIKAGKYFIIILKNLDYIARKFEEKYGIPSKFVYETIKAT